MNTRNVGQVAVVLTAVFLAVSAVAEVPQVINYQGFLTKPNGSPVNDGDYLIRFTIWQHESSTDPSDIVWSSDYREITVTNGLLSYNLGDTVNLPDDLFATDTTRWLGIKVSTDAEITPRTRLAAMPYAYHALRADTSDVALTVANDAVTSSTIQNETILFEDIGNNGTLDGQVIKWNDGVGVWQAADDELGSSGWADDGNVVRLETGVDSVGIGTSTPTEKLHVTGVIYSDAGGYRFPDGSVQTTAAFTGSDVAVITGTTSHNSLITPPAGYTVAQCKCMVSPHTFGPSGSSQEAWRHWCYVTEESGGWRVRAQSQNAHYGGLDNDIANYMVIGIK